MNPTDFLSSSALATLLALAATFLGLAAAVQILQEFWKHLSRSEARTYQQVLIDFAGPWIQQLLQPGVLNDLEARGPFQLRKVRPKGVLLPLPKNELLRAAERVAPVWVRRTIEQLQVERELQASDPNLDRSPAWQQLMSEMETLHPEDPTFWDAERVQGFLKEWREKMPSTNADALLVALRRRFLPDILRIDEFFPQLERNLEYAYHRRNLRQTFTFALLLALLFNLPFNDLLRQAAEPSLEESVAFARARLETYDTLAQSSVPPQGDRRELERQLNELLKQPGETSETPLLDRTLRKFKQLGSGGPWAIPGYLFNCLLTAMLVSFGAPFWHNLTSALWRAGRSRLDRKSTEER